MATFELTQEANMKRAVAILCLVSFVPFMSGCGVIFGGTRQVIQANSSPAGATVTTSPATQDYKTPASISLERKNETVLTFSADGYTSQKVQLQRSMRSGILVLDILFTGLLGVVVDAATGAWYRLSPEVATVSLTKVADIPGPETIQLALRADSKAGVLHVDSSTPVTITVHTE